LAEDREKVKSEASEYLYAFEKREADAEADNRARRGVADDDGFVQVVSK
jgi:hypothetical protein